jgi:hypothetical protein
MTSPMDATAEWELEQNSLKQNNTMNHQMGLKLTLAISKQEFFDAIRPTWSWASIEEEKTLVVSLTLPEKRES